MSSALQKYLEAASGLSTLTAGKAEQIVRQLVRSGEAASDQVGDMVDELLERQRGNREAATALVRSETTRAVRAMGLATSAEVERLQKQVANLKREVQRLELEAPASGTGAVATRPSFASSRPGSTPSATETAADERTTGKTAKKTAGKKAASKRTAKKAASKKTAKKTATKTASKKTAKKTAKKAASKKTAKKTAKKASSTSSASKKTAKKASN